MLIDYVRDSLRFAYALIVRTNVLVELFICTIHVHMCMIPLRITFVFEKKKL